MSIGIGSYIPKAPEKVSLSKMFVALSANMILFLPYIPTTRLRPHIVVILILSFFGTYSALVIRAYREYRQTLFWGSLLIACSAPFILFRFELSNITRVGVEFINLNLVVFVMLSAFGIRTWLSENLDHLTFVLLLLSLPINLLALFQSLYPWNGFHDYVFALYGGEPNKLFRSLGASTWAEGLVRYSGRATSIFNSMQALALFDVLIGSIGLYFLLIHIGKSDRWFRFFVFLVFVFSVLGGMAAASKTYVLSMFVGFIMIIVKLFMNNKLRSVLKLTCILGIVLFGILFLWKDNSVVIRYGMSPLNEQILASRFGGSESKGHLTNTIKLILSSPKVFLTGTGQFSRDVKYGDTLFLPPLLSGGIIVFVLYFVVIFRLWRLTSGQGFLMNPFQLPFTLYLFAGLGMQTFMINSVAPILLLLMFAYYFKHEKTVSHQEGHPSS